MFDEKYAANHLVEQFILRNPQANVSRDILYSWFVNCILLGLVEGYNAQLPIITSSKLH